jgi:hypothetical protein
MVSLLGRPQGGFIAMWYSDPAGAGHRQEAIAAMCDEFIKISREIAVERQLRAAGGRTKGREQSP